MMLHSEPDQLWIISTRNRIRLRGRCLFSAAWSQSLTWPRSILVCFGCGSASRWLSFRNKPISAQKSNCPVWEIFYSSELSCFWRYRTPVISWSFGREAWLADDCQLLTDVSSPLSAAGPQMWNSLLPRLWRPDQSLLVFRQKLKT